MYAVSRTIARELTNESLLAVESRFARLIDSGQARQVHVASWSAFRDEIARRMMTDKEFRSTRRNI